MAAPNIVQVTSIYGKTVTGALGTSSADLLTNAAASGKVFKVNACYIANIDGVNAAAVTLAMYDASAAASRSLAFTINVPADASLVVIDKNAPIYLEEGDKITGLAGTAGDLEYAISYEEIG